MRSKFTLLLSGIFFLGTFSLPLDRLQAEAASISCLQYVQLSLSGSGETVIPPEVLLANSYPDYDIFIVEIIDPPTGNDIADCSMVGDIIMVMVTNTQTNNSCWSNVLIEDKTSPIISCSEVVLPCYESVDFDDRDILIDTLYDNCTAAEDLDVWYSQTIHALNCDPLYSIYLNRIWTVTDESGNSSTCQHSIYFERGNVADVVMPQDTMLECPQINTDPGTLGFPTLNGIPINGFCELAVTFSDEIVPLCGNSFKIKRTWQIFDWCTGEMETHIQQIEILDTTAPIIDCPNDVTVFTGTQVCEGTHILPFVNVEDACADNADVNIRFRLEGILILDPLVVLPVGDHIVEVEATDPCFNASFCEYTVTVEDNVPPVLVCHNIVVTLNNNGDKIPLNVNNITDFVFIDNCGIADVEIRRMEDKCGEPGDVEFGEIIHLCCEDVADGVVTEIRAIDIYGNVNSCMFNIAVQDKLPPTITFCPPDTTINCNDEMTDLSAYGQAIAEDNCEVIYSEFSTSEIDECGEGAIFRTLIASDASGNADSCVQVITVINPFGVTPNDILWPENIFITDCDPETDPESLGSFPQVMVEHCPISFGINFSDEVTGQGEPCLLISRTWEVYDSCNQMVVGMHVQLIEVRNNAGPNLTGPEDLTVYVDETSCSAQLDLDVVEADDCSFGVVIENNFNNQGGAISDEFEVGTTTVVFIAEDECGNTSNWTVIITVLDTIPPSINCPENIVAENDPGDCGAIVNWDEPQAEDNCPGVSAIPTQLPGEFFQVGSATVTYVATDASGNTAECSFTITVQDNEPPVFVDCPGDIVINSDPGECGAIVEWQIPNAEDNCPGVALIANFESGEFFAVGTHIVNYTATDAAGNSAECSFEITVEDTESPEIVNCPQDINVVNDPGECGASVEWQLPIAEDNCPGVELTSSHESGDFFPVGTTVVTYTAIDAAGNTFQCIFEVNVEDSEDPVFVNCPDNIEISNEPGACFGIGEWEVPEGEDNCPNVEITGTHQLADTFPVGTTTVTYTATDASGNTASCSFDVIVLDEELPMIACPEDIEVNAQSGECEIFIDIDLPETSDNCGVDTFFNDFNLLEDASDIYGVGTTVVTYTVIDIFGNLDSCSFEVTVIKDFELTIVCPENVVQGNDVGVCEAFVEIELPEVTDFCELDTVFNNYNQTPNASDVYPVGVTVVVFTAIDADGVSATCEFTVIVEDAEAPEIICPDDVNTVNDPDSCSAFV
ncbi:MAG: HYR domain-containing protein, partial [Saprospirales bacterium]